MKIIKHTGLLALLLVGTFSSAAQARLALDTVSGLANLSGGLTLDSNDFVAAKFSLVSGEVITSLQAYVNAGDSGVVGDQFSFHLYSADGTNQLPGSDIYNFNASYQTDGWNGLSNLAYTVAATGNYWLALETVSSNLLLPGFLAAGSTAPITYAYSSNGGSSYTPGSTPSFGLQVTAVPIPAAAWLFGTGLFSLAFRSRRKVNTL